MKSHCGAKKQNRIVGRSFQSLKFENSEILTERRESFLDLEIPEERPEASPSAGDTSAPLRVRTVSVPHRTLSVERDTYRQIKAN